MDEVCRDLVAIFQRCLFKDHANLELSVITRMVFLVLWLAHNFGICKVTCLMVECGGVVRFGVTIAAHSFACDFLKSLVVCCNSTLP